MHFDFFTFGGALIWEDVFFYQKWRIQRNCITKTYRLLDSWDICRCSGSFEKCQKTYIQFIESYEITKQHGHMVILLHGYMEGKNIFKKMWRHFVLTNDSVASLNYPSLFRSSTASAYQILFFLNHLNDIDEVSFVTKGAGSLILRKMFNLPLDLQKFRQNIRIRNIVTINPTTSENLFCEFISRFKIGRILGGPMITDMTTQSIKHVPSLPKHINCLRIQVVTMYHHILMKILRYFNIPLINEKSYPKGTLLIKNRPFHVLDDEETINFTVNFINNGKI